MKKNGNEELKDKLKGIHDDPEFRKNYERIKLYRRILIVLIILAISFFVALNIYL